MRVLGHGRLMYDFLVTFYCDRICPHRIYDVDMELRTALIDCEELVWVWGLVLLRQASILATMKFLVALLCLVALVAADHGPYHNYKVWMLSYMSSICIEGQKMPQICREAATAASQTTN